MDRIRDIIFDMKKNIHEEHEKVMKYVNKIARLCHSEENEERQVICTMLHCLTFKLNCKNIIVKNDWLEVVYRKYSKNKTQQYNLNRKISGYILQNAYEDIRAANEDIKIQNAIQVNDSKDKKI